MGTQTPHLQISHPACGRQESPISPCRGILGQTGGVKGRTDGRDGRGKKYESLSAQRVDRPDHVRLPTRSPGRLGKVDEPLRLVEGQHAAAH